MRLRRNDLDLDRRIVGRKILDLRVRQFLRRDGHHLVLAHAGAVLVKGLGEVILDLAGDVRRLRVLRRRRPRTRL